MEKKISDCSAGKAEKRKRKNRVEWTTEAELLLLSVWEEFSNDLRTARKNYHVYSLMEKVFKDNKFEKITADEIKTKIANLSKRYR